MNLEATARVLENLGYSVRCFDAKEDAAGYLDRTVDQKTVGFGGSMTLEAMRLWELLSGHNTVYSHLHGIPAGPAAAGAQVYISSVNALAETGELVLIDGDGNRASAVLYGHERVIFAVGRNKLAHSYEAAVRRARNIAAPMNARRKKKRTPCAQSAARCFDCGAEERICRAMVTLWRPVSSMEMEVLLINEDLGF